MQSMAYRFTNTDKWNDSWFSELKPIEKLLFIYLCDNCDIAGFIEINIKRWCADIDTDRRTIEGALEGLSRGIIFSKMNDCLYVKNFLKHQKNLPLNENNRAHIGVIARFGVYSEKFDIKDITEFIKGASMGLTSPYGIGNGNGIGKKGKEGVGEKPKKSREIKTFIPPTIYEAETYFTENGYKKESAKKFIEYYSVADWKDSKGNQVRNWKQKAQAVWFKDEHKIVPTNKKDFTPKIEALPR